MMKKNTALKNFLLPSLSIMILCGIYFLLPSSLVHADPPTPVNYNLLTPLPGIGGTVNAADPISYIQALHRLFISLAIVLAVFMIVYGGILYMSTDAIQGKSDGKRIIQQALWGLLLVLIATLILQTINPNILNLANVIPVYNPTLTSASFGTTSSTPPPGWFLTTTGPSGTTYTSEGGQDACTAAAAQTPPPNTTFACNRSTI